MDLPASAFLHPAGENRDEVEEFMQQALAVLRLEMSPVFSRLEPLLLQRIAQQLGLDLEASGVMVSGGSLGNLQAIAVARNRHFPVLEEGLAALTNPPVFFTS